MLLIPAMLATVSILVCQTKIGQHAFGNGVRALPRIKRQWSRSLISGQVDGHGLPCHQNTWKSRRLLASARNRESKSWMAVPEPLTVFHAPRPERQWR